MSDDVAALEQHLVEGYREQLRHYERALQSADEPAEVKDLLAALDVIARSDAAIAAAKNAWRLSGRSPGPELRAILDLVAGRIRALADCVDRRIARTEARKQELMPDADAIILRRRTLHAYGKL